MIRRSFRIGLWLGLLGGILFAVVKVLQSRQPAVEPLTGRDLVGHSPRPTSPWPPLDARSPAPAASPSTTAVEDDEPEATVPKKQAPATKAASKKKAAPAKKATTAAPRPKKAAAAKKVAPSWVDPDGNICPRSHPVKAKLSSRIYQLPGMFAYERTNPDRCYRDADAAAGDGFRAAKR